MRRRRRSQGATFGLSLLDLLSCAFGGVIVLAVVMSALLGSRRALENRSFLILDVTVSAPEENPSAERRRAVEQLVLGLELEGPDWKTAWRGSESTLAIPDSGVFASVLSGRADSQSGRRHLTILLRGLAEGEYLATLDAVGMEGSGSEAGEAYRGQLEGRPLRAQIEIHHPGGRGRPISAASVLTLGYPLWQGGFQVHLED